MSMRREFVRLALQEGTNRRELCRRYGVHPETGYKWIERWVSGDRELDDRSRRPQSSPNRTVTELERRIVEIRDAHPAWGARKIATKLVERGIDPPAVSTIHQVLRRHDRIAPVPGAPSPALLRFEKEAPNLLWQMDFKGWVRLTTNARCHPLTILDDHSRFNLCLKACANQQRITVQQHLEATFGIYGLPDAVFVDNGSPWGDSSGRHWTRLRVWLLKYGVEVIYSRPYHPQSRGKIERFHRTLLAEVLAMQRFTSFAQMQRAFDEWHEVYNFERPHQALDQRVPADLYRPSTRRLPAKLPRVEYDAGEIVRTVPESKDYINFKGRLWKVPEAFRGERVALRPRGRDGLYGVFFASHQIATIDLAED